MAHIPIPSGSVFGQEVKEALRQVQRVHDHYFHVLEKMAQMSTGGNYVPLEAATGVEAGQGTLLFAEMDSVKAQLANATAAVNQAAAIIG